jgi:hypothetical protein
MVSTLSEDPAAEFRELLRNLPSAADLEAELNELLKDAGL